jgi:hypothetical protein
MAAASFCWASVNRPAPKITSASTAYCFERAFASSVVPGESSAFAVTLAMYASALSGSFNRR